MKKENGKVSDVKIAYIGGGSRAWARKLMCDLVLEETISGSVALYDINEDAAKDNAIIGNKIATDKKAKSKWNFYVVNSMEEALTGADFVVLSILPNTFREMHAEVHMPEQLGIYQSVGDTAGFGGYMRAMRTAPIYIEFAKDLKKYCPNAWVINYTNPMTLCTRILYEYFPEIKMFGCCHEVFGAQKVLAKAYAEITGEEEPAREDIKTDVTGINHFTWVTKASYKDVDLFPIFKQVAEKYAEEGFYEGEDHANCNSVGYCGNVIKFELFKRYGYIPAAGDRHLAEFLNGQWYLKSAKKAREKRFNLTSVDWRIAGRDRLLEQSKKMVSGEEEVVVNPSGEEGVRQIKAILGLEDLITNVNLPNKGQIAGYPYGAVVETNAKFTENSVEPIPTTPLPDELNAMIIKHVYHHEAFIKALKNKDVEAVKNIIADDPQCGVASYEDVSRVFDEIYEHNKDSLDYYWKN
jgi:alpha-galactosidase